MRWKKTFPPPDFGGAHPSDPRLHVKFYAYYFGDTTLGWGGNFPLAGTLSGLDLLVGIDQGQDAETRCI